MELKPCPFCGRRPVDDLGTITCANCGGRAYSMKWNHRPIEDRLLGQMAQLRLEIVALEDGLDQRHREFDELFDEADKIRRERDELNKLLDEVDRITDAFDPRIVNGTIVIQQVRDILAKRNKEEE